MPLKSLFYVALAVALLVKVGLLSNPFATSQDYVAEYEGQVVLYATTWCGYCKKVREFMKQNGIEYTEYDIEKSSKGHSQYKELGGRGVPLMVVNGNVIRGYNPRAILQGVKGM